MNVVIFWNRMKTVEQIHGSAHSDFYFKIVSAEPIFSSECQQFCLQFVTNLLQINYFLSLIVQ